MKNKIKSGIGDRILGSFIAILVFIFFQGLVEKCDTDIDTEEKTEQR